MSLISGVSFPFRFDGRGRVAGSTDEQHIKESIQQILLTAKGSVPFKPTFGSHIRRRVFDPVNTGALIRDDALEALREWERRITNVQVKLISPDTVPQGEVHYRITYQIKGTEELQELMQTQAV